MWGAGSGGPAAYTANATPPWASRKRKRPKSAADSRCRRHKAVRAGQTGPARKGPGSAMPRHGWGHPPVVSGPAGPLGLLTAVPPIPLGRVQVASRRSPATRLGRAPRALARAPAAATPPSPTGSSRDGRERWWRSAGPDGPACSWFRPARGADLRSGQDSQGDARAAPDWLSWTRGQGPKLA